MNYKEWEQSVPAEITGDRLWRMEVYRLALFAADLSWADVTKLVRDRRMMRLSDQLYRAVGSISANVSEGYSRGTGRDRARFYEYALGSARESRDWYFKGRHILGETVTAHRIDLLTQIIRLLLTIVPAQRRTTLKEESAVYTSIPSDLLTNVPLPDSRNTGHATRDTQHVTRNTKQEHHP
jgi:four helix bundle protein